MSEGRTPVIIGVGQVTNRGDDPTDARDPLTLMGEALAAAADDSGAGPRALRELDGLDVVSLVSWSYGDVAAELATAVGANPAHTALSPWGGNQPTLLVDRAAERIARGELRCAAVVGAEAFRSLERALKAGAVPPWPSPPPEAPAPPNARSEVPDAAWNHGLRMPIEVYPLYENAFRADALLTFDESQDWSASLWAGMSRVAAANDGAWNPTPLDPAEIRAVSDRNRMVCYPYPKLMNALLSVDQGAAILLADTETARRLGVAESQWVYPWGGAGAHDPDDILARTTYARSPAMETVLDDVGATAGVELDEIDLVELYSCFPCVPKMALRHLGWARDHPISVTGGLTFFGGPGNDYMGHALVAMTRALRTGTGTTGLLYGQGGFVTKHHALVLATEPRSGPYPSGGATGDAKRQASVDALAAPRLELVPKGDATIESFTVAYARSGEPELGIVLGRLADGARFVANTPPGDREHLDRLADDATESIGDAGTVGQDPTTGTNVFQIAAGR